MYDEDMKIYIPSCGEKNIEVSSSSEVRIYRPSQPEDNPNSSPSAAGIREPGSGNH